MAHWHTLYVGIGGQHNIRTSLELISTFYTLQLKAPPLARYYKGNVAWAVLRKYTSLFIQFPPASVLPAVSYALTFDPSKAWAHCSCCRMEWPSSHFLTQPPPCLPLLNKCSQLARSLTRLLATWPPESPSLPAHSFCPGRAHPTKWHFYTDARARTEQFPY